MGAQNGFRHGIACLLLTLLLALIVHFARTIADPLSNTLTSGDHGITISSGYWLDPSAAVRVSEAAQQPQLMAESDFAEIPWSFEQQAYWLRLTLTNSAADPRVLVVHFANPMLEQLDLYRQADGRAAEHIRLGWQAQDLTVEQRAIPSYEWLLDGHSSQQLYIRIATEGIAKTPVQLFTPQDFNALVRSKFLIWGGFVGILIVIALFNLVLYSGLKDGIYLVYIGYIVSILMMLGVVIGFGHYIWPEGVIRLLRSQIVTVNLLVVIFTMSFALLFFSLLSSRERIVRWFKRYLLLMVALAIVALGLPEYRAAPLFFAAMVVLYPLIALLLYRQFRLNYRWAGYYLISWVPLIVGGALQPMVLTGVLEGSFLLNHALMVGVLSEIVLMAMALANRMQFKKEQALFNATHDPGTALPNSNLLDASLQHLVKEEQPFSVCLVEVVGFPGLQPYISNSNSDELMLMIARTINRELLYQPDFLILESCAAKPQRVVHIKDGLLAVILLDYSPALAASLFHTIQQQLSSGAQLGELYVSLSLRFGLSLYSRHNNEELPDVLKQAQQALDQAKHQHQPVALYQADQAYGLTQRLSLAAGLQAALKNDALQLYHQPQINLHSGRVDGSEVLLRWHHAELGFIPPSEFILLAEDTGIVNELTLWVIDRACQHLQQLRQEGFVNYNVSLNISGKDIAEPDFLDNVRAILRRYPIPLQNLTFELTESVTVSDFHLLQHTLDALTAMGINIAIDDYGTGYSSLFYIAELPFTELKIDKSFVSDLDDSGRHLTIVKTTIEMAKRLGLRVVAEGIETAAVETLLKEHDCQLAQGFYYRKPSPFDQYLSWLKQS